jgi:hypothetical protein
MIVRVASWRRPCFLAIVDVGQPGLGRASALHPVGQRDLLLAARAVRPARAGASVVSDVGNGENSIDAVGHRHSLRGFFTVVVGEVLAKYCCSRRACV